MPLAAQIGGTIASVPGPSTIGTVTGSIAHVYSAPLEWPDPRQVSMKFGSTTSYGNIQTFLVIGQLGEWYQVILPIRQNGTAGWIHGTQLSVATQNYRVVVSRSNHTVDIYEGDKKIISTGVVTGKSSTPTPVGTFYITDKLRHAKPTGAYGPWILALSARSEALNSFNGGEPVVAMHGTNKPWLVGSSKSNGCIRMDNDQITLIASIVPIGTRVDIVR